MGHISRFVLLHACGFNVNPRAVGTSGPVSFVCTQAVGGTSDLPVQSVMLMSSLR